MKKKLTPQKNILTLSGLALFAGVASSNAAFTWDTMTYQIDSGTPVSVLYTDSPWSATGNTFGSLGTGSSLTGSFDTNASGTITTLNFSYSVTGGTADFGISDHDSLGGFYRFQLSPDDSATGIDYDFNYVQPIQGSSNAAFVLGGMFVAADNASTLLYSVQDDFLSSLDLSDGDIWRTNNVGSTNFQNPNSYQTSGTEAVLNVAAAQNEGLGWVRESSGTPAQNVGRVFGSLTGDGGSALGENTLFLTTFNGDFSGTDGLLVVPEPSVMGALALGLIGFGLRRRRR